MKIRILIALFFSCSVMLFSQSNIESELMQQAKAEKIINNHLAKVVAEKDYVLFSIADQLYLIIVKNEEKYHEYFIKNDLLIFQDKLKNNKNILEKVFDYNNYIEKGSAFYDPSKMTLGNGNKTYFYLMSKNSVKYGETFSVTMIAPTPIDSDVYYYLLNRLLILDNKIE